VLCPAPALKRPKSIESIPAAPEAMAAIGTGVGLSNPHGFCSLIAVLFPLPANPAKGVSVVFYQAEGKKIGSGHGVEGDEVIVVRVGHHLHQRDAAARGRV
jgi:hypothetical protein